MRWTLALFLLAVACDAGIDAPAPDLEQATRQGDAPRTSAGDRSEPRALVLRDGGACGALGPLGHLDEHATDASAPGPAGDEDASTLARALLMELDRGARISCPCKVQRGDFPSEPECIAAIGYRESDIECVGNSSAQVDRLTVRAMLACENKRARLRNDCHAAAACAEDAVSACDASQIECGPPDTEALTKVLADCPGATVFGR
jgi:hypothetical protein